mmetsp:Transcript_47243/g.134438  ORF Transcript_47243/g.134438 Transcript_47243/m.134438 type:complete len:251 (-) Transcript_47243:183-935(-)
MAPEGWPRVPLRRTRARVEASHAATPEKLRHLVVPRHLVQVAAMPVYPGIQQLVRWDPDRTRCEYSARLGEDRHRKRHEVVQVRRHEEVEPIRQKAVRGQRTSRPRQRHVLAPRLARLVRAQDLHAGGVAGREAATADPEAAIDVAPIALHHVERPARDRLLTSAAMPRPEVAADLPLHPRRCSTLRQLPQPSVAAPRVGHEVRPRALRPAQAAIRGATRGLNPGHGRRPVAGPAAVAAQHSNPNISKLQ